MSPCGTWMKLPCLKAEWLRNLPICGGDCHSMKGQVIVNPWSSFCWPGFPILSSWPPHWMLYNHFKQVQLQNKKSWFFAVG